MGFDEYLSERNDFGSDIGWINWYDDARRWLEVVEVEWAESIDFGSRKERGELRCADPSSISLNLSRSLVLSAQREWI